MTDTSFEIDAQHENCKNKNAGKVLLCERQVIDMEHDNARAVLARRRHTEAK